MLIIVNIQSGILEIPQPYVKEMFDIVFIFVIENLALKKKSLKTIYILFPILNAVFFWRGGKLFCIVFFIFFKSKVRHIISFNSSNVLIKTSWLL